MADNFEFYAVYFQVEVEDDDTYQDSVFFRTLEQAKTYAPDLEENLQFIIRYSGNSERFIPTDRWIWADAPQCWVYDGKV